MADRARAYWMGHIRLSLVTFPVRLYAAVTDTKKIQLHKISKNTGERIHYKDSTASEDLVEKEDISKGFEYEKGQYVEISDKELRKLKAESSHTIDLVQFTDLKDIDPVYFDRPYFVAPDGDIANEAYVTVRDALASSKKVALGQITMAGRERIAAIKAYDNGLILETLRYNYEVREAKDYFADVDNHVRISKDQVELAELLIKQKTRKFDPRAFKDTYQEGLKALIEAKIGRRPIHLPEERPHRTENVVNIMDALKRSLAGAKEGAPARENGHARKPVRKAAAKKPAAKAHTAKTNTTRRHVRAGRDGASARI